MTDTRLNLLGKNRAELAAWLSGLGEKPFRAKQLTRWVYQAGAADFEAMHDLPADLRTRLAAVASIDTPRQVNEHRSTDGTIKWLFDVGARNHIETVFIPEAKRGTLCISSQVGCALECSFCATGAQGFNRNLGVSEIIGQLVHAERVLERDNPGGGHMRAITNVVMMGMGEPLLNFENVVAALDLMLDDEAFGLSRRRVTVSSSGIVPAIDRLRERCPVALAISLHAPNDRLRDILVPINKKYPLRELLAACERYLEKAPRDFITFEYVMLRGVNDQFEQAAELTALLRDFPCKINLIPFNPYVGTDYERAQADTVTRFAEYLQARGMVTTIRKTRGDDIAAACGQLAGRVEDKTRRVLRRSEVRP